MASNFMNNPGVSPQTSVAISSRNRLYTANYASSGGVGFGNFVGALSNFAPSQARGVTEVRGIGLGDKIIEAVPNYQDMTTISVSRTLFYLSSMWETFGYRAGISGFVRALRHHKHPFQIRNELVLSETAMLFGNANTLLNAGMSAMSTLLAQNPTGQQAVAAASPAQVNSAIASIAPKAIITLYLGCWFTDYSSAVTSDNSIIAEEGSIACPEITDGSTAFLDIFADTGNLPGAFQSIGALAKQVGGGALGSVLGAF
jgi:hypothetical protein